MKTELCSFSGIKIYPGKGRTFVKADGKTFKFLSKKAQTAFDRKSNPRKVRWTALYRRKMRKGAVEEHSKKKSKKTTKFQRAIVGATLNEILAKKHQKPEVRKAQREQAIKAAKEARVAAAKSKKGGASAPKDPKAKAAPKVAKAANFHKAAPRVGGKR